MCIFFCVFFEMSLVVLVNTSCECFGNETVYLDELEKQTKEQQERMERVSIELLHIQKEIAQVKKELEELLD